MTDVAAQAGTADAAARRALVQELADRLGETERGPRALLTRGVATLGEERARAFLAETLAVEEAGGLLLPDGSRRRTPGGVFFHLVRRGVDRDERRQIFPPGAQRAPGRGGAGAGGQAASPGATGPAFTWDDYPAAIAALQQGIGEATTVKITVIGRPARVVERSDVAIVTLRSEKVPSLPKGLPAPAQPTDYAVLITLGHMMWGLPRSWCIRLRSRVAALKNGWSTTSRRNIRAILAPLPPHFERNLPEAPTSRETPRCCGEA